MIYLELTDWEWAWERDSITEAQEAENGNDV